MRGTPAGCRWCCLVAAAAGGSGSVTADVVVSCHSYEQPQAAPRVILTSEKREAVCSCDGEI